MLKDGFAGCTPAVRRPTYKPQRGAATISRRGGFYIRPGWFPQTGAFVGPRAGHARPLHGCCNFLREAQKNPSVSKKVCSPLGPLCEGAPPAGGGGENCTAARNISGYGKVLSLRPFGAPPSQREVFRQSAIFCASHKKIPHRPEQRTMGAKRNKQTAKKAQSKTPKRRRSLLLAGTAPERQTAG